MPERTGTILIVEDDHELRRLYRMALVVAGFEVREAADGLAALQHIELEPPDLIVLDLLLPGVDGRTVLDELAAQARTRHVPIIVVTASNFPVAPWSVKCVLRKPIDLDELVTMVRQCLGKGDAER